MPTPPSSRHRVSVPKQARSRETFDRFLDATEALLVERPYEEVTIAEIVLRAERGNGSFYSRFGDKDGVLLALTDRNWSATAPSCEVTSIRRAGPSGSSARPCARPPGWCSSATGCRGCR